MCGCRWQVGGGTFVVAPAVTGRSWWRRSITKINFDGAYNKQMKQLGRCIIYRNLKAENLGAKMIFNDRVLIPFAAEAIACLQAIHAGLEMRVRQIVIEGDALSVIRQ
ncbi:hypothetical protein Gotri_027163 [Gossypium trilobum]|uniref:RNase H type-1 domain-containing protein n=1 Tax=Gossypium trilobum TaxID=34281 RepID=A0A7J9FIP9_9ROSI|nr:hypothetical protein [Gossypium trilobum]